MKVKQIAIINIVTTIIKNEKNERERKRPSSEGKQQKNLKDTVLRWLK